MMTDRTVARSEQRQDNLFSMVANQTMQTTIQVWSQRHRVLVIARLPDPDGKPWLYGPDGTYQFNTAYRPPDPNYEFPRARGKVVEYITRVVRDLIEPHGWLDDGWSLTMREDPMMRGSYIFTVWRPKKIN